MREVLEVIEILDIDTKDQRTAIIWKEDENYFFSEVAGVVKKENVDLDSLSNLSIPMNMKLFFGTWKEGLTEAPEFMLNDPNYYIKTVPLINYTPGVHIGQFLVSEAELFEELQKRGTHPNICEYYGCVRNRESISGLCLKKYKEDIYLPVIRSELGLDQRRRIFEGIIAGVKYLHNQGFAHNDLSPVNIVMYNEGNAVIIDFDSCTKVGESNEQRKLVKGGTFLWSRQDDPNAPETDDVFANDTYSLDLLHNFLFSECPEIKAGSGISKDNYEGHCCNITMAI